MRNENFDSFIHSLTHQIVHGVKLINLLLLRHIGLHGENELAAQSALARFPAIQTLLAKRVLAARNVRVHKELRAERACNVHSHLWMALLETLIRRGIEEGGEKRNTGVAHRPQNSP